MAGSLETVLLSLREVLIIEDQLTSACPQTEVLEILEDSAFCRHSMIITMHHAMKKTKNFGYESVEEGIC